MLSISLQKFAKGFSHQKGAIFGFGENSNNDTGSVVRISRLLRISRLGETEIEHRSQSKVPVHNVGKERNVGFFNYEIEFRGKKC